MSAVLRTRDALRDEGAVLCVRLDTADGLVERCRAAVRGGLRALEVTLTTPGALDALGALAELPD
ncbi:MAG: hypothetical protein R3263_05580, partial [Myxococcota bacterium]|nr:hypothetical protein [Myxococcota bacterium]